MILFVVAAAAALPAFDYKGIVSGQQIESARLQHCDEPMPEYCSVIVADENIDGLRPLLTSMTAYKGKLSSVSIMADAIAFQHITNAFTAKYGRACATSVPLWQSRIGRPVPNPTMVWCFRAGKLRAAMHGADLDVSEIEYRDANQPPKIAPKPKIDF